MTRSQFKQYLRNIEDINELTGKLSEIGIDTSGCRELLYAEDIFFSWLSDDFIRDARDMVAMWLYGEGEKVIGLEDGTIVNVEDIDDLYSYLDKNFRR